MSVVAILCLTAIVAAFALFAVVLAWGDYQTRNITHAPRNERAPRGTAAGVATLREVAKEAKEPIHAA
jgi:hypothetical protein